MVSVTCSWRATGCRTIYRSCWTNGCAPRTAGTVSSQNKNNHTVCGLYKATSSDTPVVHRTGNLPVVD